MSKTEKLRRLAASAMSARRKLHLIADGLKSVKMRKEALNVYGCTDRLRIVADELTRVADANRDPRGGRRVLPTETSL